MNKMSGSFNEKKKKTDSLSRYGIVNMLNNKYVYILTNVGYKINGI